MNVYTYGGDERLDACRMYLSDIEVSGCEEVCLLPVPTSRDEKTVLGVDPEVVAERFSSSDVVVGYSVPKKLKELFSHRGALVIDVSKDEEFLKENAVLTAIATVGRILSSEKRAPSDLKIALVGYGRIGERLLCYLEFFGADVTVFTTRSELSHELAMIGVSSLSSSVLKDEGECRCLLDFDLIVNTAPSPLLCSSACEMLAGKRVIELASGDNFPRDMKVERLMALPAKAYPVSAGRILARSVLRMLGADGAL